MDSKILVDIFQVIRNDWINWIIFYDILLTNDVTILLQGASHQLQSAKMFTKHKWNKNWLLKVSLAENVYLSLIDTCVLSHSVIFSFDHPAATCGLAKSLPAWPKSSNNTINGDTGPSISIDFFDSSSGVSVIRLDSDRRVLKSKDDRKSFKI